MPAVISVASSAKRARLRRYLMLQNKRSNISRIFCQKSQIEAVYGIVDTKCILSVASSAKRARLRRDRYIVGQRSVLGRIFCQKSQIEAVTKEAAFARRECRIFCQKSQIEAVFPLSQLRIPSNVASSAKRARLRRKMISLV